MLTEPTHTTLWREASTLLTRFRFYLRRQPFDDADTLGRSHERNRRALISGLTSTVTRAANVLVLLVSIPLTLGYLGVERFGVWMTLTSFGALLAFADFGLGNGLVNAVAVADARRDSAQVRTYVSTSLAGLAGIAILIIAGWTAFGSSIPWSRVFAIAADSSIDEEVHAAMAAFVLCLAVGIPATIVQRVQTALQMGYVASLWQLASAAASLAGLVAVVLSKGALVWLTLAMFGVPVLVNVLNSIVFWNRVRPAERPAPRFVQRREARFLLRSGFLFFIMQLAVSIAFASDNLIIAQMFGPPAVAQYSIVARLFEGMVLLVGMFTMPLWPAYAEASARGDTQWIRETLLRTTRAIMIITAVAAGLFVFASKWMIETWVGSAVGYSFALVAAYGVWTVFKSVGTTIAVFLNGMNLIRIQALLAICFAAVSIAAKLALAQWLGLVGVPLALLLTYALVVLVPYGVLLQKTLQKP